MESTQDLVVSNKASDPGNLRMVALTPSDVTAEQGKLITWCQQKMASLSSDKKELEESLAIAVKNRWRQTTLKKHIALHEKRIVYYDKIRAASEAGYLIVPNFDVEVMAVRTKRLNPKWACESYQGSDKVGLARPDILPVGQGAYVDDKNIVEHREFTNKNDKGVTTTHRYTPIGFNDPDFPVLAVKPILLEATALAMSKKIFDRIGVVTGKKTDPVVVGQIIDPRGGLTQWHQPRRVVTFFIAWWLDTDML